MYYSTPPPRGTRLQIERAVRLYLALMAIIMLSGPFFESHEIKNVEHLSKNQNAHHEPSVSGEPYALEPEEHKINKAHHMVWLTEYHNHHHDEHKGHHPDHDHIDPAEVEAPEKIQTSEILKTTINSASNQTRIIAGCQNDTFKQSESEVV